MSTVIPRATTKGKAAGRYWISNLLPTARHTSMSVEGGESSQFYTQQTVSNAYIFAFLIAVTISDRNKEEREELF